MFGMLGCDPEATYKAGEEFDNLGFKLGALAYSPRGGIYQFVKANEAITANYLVFLKADNLIEACATADVTAGQTCTLGVAEVAIAQNDYGWICRYGRSAIITNAATGSAVPLFTTATAGRVDDATVNTIRVQGLFSIGGGGAAGALCTAMLNWPFAMLA